jgi:hypothetical protein
MSSGSPAPKRQKVGSLLQFGFTEAQRSKPLVPSIASTELVECQACSKPFPVDKIGQHAAICEALSSPGAGKNLRNAFDVMKSSSSFANQRTETKMVFFALLKKDDRLLPLFYHDASHTSELFQNSGNKYNLWEADSNVRKFRVAFRDSGFSSKRDVVLHLVTNLASVGTDSVDQFVAPHNSGRSGAARSPGAPPVSVSVLKSMIQKAVRRKQTLKAIRLATMLCDYDAPVAPAMGRGPASPLKKGATGTAGPAARPAGKLGGTNPNSPLSELLRRLPIICFEDTALHPALPVIVWLMIAVTKGYRPPASLIHVVLLIIADIAGCAYKDCTPPHHSDFSTLPALRLSASANTSNSSESTAADTAASATSNSTAGATEPTYVLNSIRDDAARTLIASICLRASFGGMVFDMQMLDVYAQLWYERLACYITTTSAGSTGDAKFTAEPLSAGCACLHEGYVQGLLRANEVWAKQAFDNMASSVPGGGGVAPMVSDLSTFASGKLQALCQALLSDPVTPSQTATSQATPVAAQTDTAPDALTLLLQLTPSDLVPEGLDQHVDYSLVPHLVNTCRDKLMAHLDATSSAGAGEGKSGVKQEGASGSDAGDGILDSSPVKASAIDIPDALLQDVQSSIWLFRSSCNSRKLYPLLFTLASQVPATHDFSAEIVAFSRQLTEKELAGKRRRAKLWGIICPMLVAYCERKVANMARRLI